MPGRSDRRRGAEGEAPSVAEIPLAVGKTSRFRTWAFTRKARVAGESTAVVRDANHKVLARQTFKVI